MSKRKSKQPSAGVEAAEGHTVVVEVSRPAPQIVGDYLQTRATIAPHFDGTFYLDRYLDVRDAGLNPLDHYLTHGWKEGRDPSPGFSTRYYIEQNEDVQRSEVNPYYHYILVGRAEGREPEPPGAAEDRMQPAPVATEEIFARETVAQYFDRQYYLETYEDVRRAGIDPLHHFLSQGWREGRNPNAEFDTVFYSENNDDVRQAEVNPFYHYIVAGKLEGRLPKAPPAPVIDESPPEPQPAAQPDSKYQHMRNAVAPYFDAQFYLEQNRDIAAASIDPLDHYMMTGWREERDPCWEFDTSFYLYSYGDIRDAGVNPFYHYIVAGKREGRKARDELAAEIAVIRDCTSPREKALTWIRQLPKETSGKAMSAAIGKALKARARGTFVAVSNDNYLENTGGIQNCLADEQTLFNKSEYNYVHLFPAQPLPKLSDETKAAKLLMSMSVNGSLIGMASLTTIERALKERLPKSAERVQEGAPAPIFIMHSLLGHSPEALFGFVKAIGVSKSYYWIHDYFSLCENYTLTRSDLTFCNAPPATSQSCRTCPYGLERKKHQSRIGKLFDALAPAVIAPSQAALDTWLKASGHPSDSAEIILPHVEFVGDLLKAKKPTAKLDAKEPVRIGHLGYDKFHKGWSVFERLAVKFHEDQRYQFHHLGRRQRRFPYVTYHDVSVSQQHRNAMADAVRRNHLDAVVIWPNWAETFSFVAFEALAGGALVITHPASGNVAKAVEKYNAGVVLKDEDELIAFLEGDEFRKLCLQRRRKPAPLGRMKYSGCTAALVANASRAAR